MKEFRVFLSDSKGKSETIIKAVSLQSVQLLFSSSSHLRIIKIEEVNGK